MAKNNPNKKAKNNGALKAKIEQVEKRKAEENTGKKGLDVNERGEGSQRSEKESKRRSSLTGSPLTSSSSSADDSELRKDLKSPFSSVNSVNSCSSTATTSHSSAFKTTINDLECSKPKVGAESHSSMLKKSASQKNSKKKHEDKLKSKKVSVNTSALNSSVNTSTSSNTSSTLEKEDFIDNKASICLSEKTKKTQPFVGSSYSTASQPATVSTVSTVTSLMSCGADSKIKLENGKEGFSQPELDQAPLCKELENAKETQTQNFYVNAEVHQKMSSIATKQFSSNIMEHVHATPSTWSHINTSYMSICTNLTFDEDIKILEQTLVKSNQAMIRAISNEYLSNLHRVMRFGLYGQTFRYIRLAACILIKERNIKKNAEAVFLRLLLERVVISFSDFGNAISLFMVLCSSSQCVSVNHGFCKTLKTLLRHISSEILKSALFIEGAKKSLLHVAAMLGEVCQLNVVLDMGVNPNVFDDSGRTPLHYALARKKFDMLQSLMFYGADMALCPYGSLKYSSLKAEIARFPFESYLMPDTYLNRRMIALKVRFMCWVQDACASIKDLKILYPKSPLHAVKIRVIEDPDKDEVERFATLTIERSRLSQKIVLFLFIMPSVFTVDDIGKSPDDPCFYRPIYCPIQIADEAILMEGECVSEAKPFAALHSVFPALNKDSVYAFQVPVKACFRDSAAHDTISYLVKMRLTGPTSMRFITSPQAPLDQIKVPFLSMMLFACHYDVTAANKSTKKNQR